MDILKYLQADHEHLQGRLIELTRNYSKLSAAQVHEKSVHIFEAIQKHFKRQEDLLLENGSLVCASAVLGLTAGRGWLFLTALLGAGQIFTAMTGNCALALMLARAPWNSSADSKS